MIDQKLLDKIEDELREDLYSRYDGDFNAWEEVVFDCPSADLEKLLGQIPEAQREEYDEMIDQIMQDLCDEQDLGDDDDEDLDEEDDEDLDDEDE